MTVETIARLDAIASAKGVSRSAVIRWAVEDYFNSIFLGKCSPEKEEYHQEEQDRKPEQV
ncbi:MAG: ribbon-helix-helix protein, CopG family [Chloroflexaceae bacterium]|nr:ribbon-helix-helix protein, CopG family [Chloroflexaceae bacterium]